MISLQTKKLTFYVKAFESYRITDRHRERERETDRRMWPKKLPGRFAGRNYRLTVYSVTAAFSPYSATLIIQ